MNMADPNKSCYGSNNKDSKGGTWQVSFAIRYMRNLDILILPQMEDNHLTFHALPAADSDVNKPHDELRI